MIFKSYLVENNIKILDKKLVLFYGENIGLKNDFKNNLLKVFKNDEIIRLNQEEIIKNKNKLFNEINNISLFEKKKTFLIENINDRILEILIELDTTGIADNKIYLFSDILDKKSKLRAFFEKSKKYGVVACYPDNEISIRKIIQEKLKEFKGLNQQTINLIVENCNLNRVKLNNEIEKIKACFQNKILEEEKLINLLDARINSDFDMLKNAAFAGDLEKTNKLLSDTIMEDEKNVFYLNSINQTLNRLIQVCDMNVGDIEIAINQLRPPIFWKDKPIFKDQAKIWRKEKIKKMLDETHKLEISIKSNALAKKNILLKKIIVDLCFAANS